MSDDTSLMDSFPFLPSRLPTSSGQIFWTTSQPWTTHDRRPSGRRGIPMMQCGQLLWPCTMPPFSWRMGQWGVETCHYWTSLMLIVKSITSSWGLQ